MESISRSRSRSKSIHSYLPRIEQLKSNIKEFEDKIKTLDQEYINSSTIQERNKKHEEIIEKMSTLEMIQKELGNKIKQHSLSIKRGGKLKNKSKKNR